MRRATTPTSLMNREGTMDAGVPEVIGSENVGGRRHEESASSPGVDAIPSCRHGADPGAAGTSYSARR